MNPSQENKHHLFVCMFRYKSMDRRVELGEQQQICCMNGLFLVPDGQKRLK